MVVGMCRVVLSLPGNDSLKGKRSVVKSALERARARFQVAAAEVADMDNHRRATLGFSVVSNDARHARSIMDKVVSFVASAGAAQVIDHAVSVEHYELASSLESFSGAGESWEDDDGDEEG